MAGFCIVMGRRGRRMVKLGFSEMRADSRPPRPCSRLPAAGAVVPACPSLPLDAGRGSRPDSRPGSRRTQGTRPRIGSVAHSRTAKATRAAYARVRSAGPGPDGGALPRLRRQRMGGRRGACEVPTMQGFPVGALSYSTAHERERPIAVPWRSRVSAAGVACRARGGPTRGMSMNCCIRPALGNGVRRDALGPSRRPGKRGRVCGAGFVKH